MVLHKRLNKDLIPLDLEDIGRVKLLSEEDEVLLSRLVQKREAILTQQKELSHKHNEIDELLRLEEIQKRGESFFSLAN